MEQREITDKENITWTCVQAYAGLQSENTDEVVGQNGNGTVTVICTPSGGAQTVRLELEPDWLESVSDDVLTEKITAAR